MGEAPVCVWSPEPLSSRPRLQVSQRPCRRAKLVDLEDSLAVLGGQAEPASPAVCSVPGSLLALLVL